MRTSFLLVFTGHNGENDFVSFQRSCLSMEHVVTELLRFSDDFTTLQVSIVQVEPEVSSELASER